MMYKKLFKLIDLIAFAVVIIASCSSSLPQVNNKMLIGEWDGKWDDISVLLEFNENGKGSITYSNPYEKLLFDYSIKKDTLIRKMNNKETFYKISMSDKNTLQLSTSNYIEEFTPIIELITFKRKN